MTQYSQIVLLLFYSFPCCLRIVSVNTGEISNLLFLTWPKGQKISSLLCTGSTKSWHPVLYFPSKFLQHLTLSHLRDRSRNPHEGFCVVLSAWDAKKPFPHHLKWLWQVSKLAASLGQVLSATSQRLVFREKCMCGSSRCCFRTYFAWDTVMGEGDSDEHPLSSFEENTCSAKRRLKLHDFRLTTSVCICLNCQRVGYSTW